MQTNMSLYVLYMSLYNMSLFFQYPALFAHYLYAKFNNCIVLCSVAIVHDVNM